MRRLQSDIAASVDITGDTTMLADYGVIVKLHLGAVCEERQRGSSMIWCGNRPSGTSGDLIMA